MSVFVADVVGRLSDELMRYDEQLTQNLTREERIAKLKGARRTDHRQSRGARI